MEITQSNEIDEREIERKRGGCNPLECLNGL